MAAVPTELKALSPFIRRAEELDKDGRRETKVVAYYCRQYAMELGIAQQEEVKDKAAAQAFLLSLIERLEKDKDSSVSKEDGEQILFKFASDVFDRADAEDRNGKATKATAKTFFAASVFFDTMKQFGERGSEADEKCRYAKWKATDILKAIKEGREPTPGGPAHTESVELGMSSLEIPVAPSASSHTAAPPKDDDLVREMPPDYVTIERSPPVPVVDSPVPREVHKQKQTPLTKSASIGDIQVADALEYARFAVAALEANDIALAVERLQGALGTLTS